MTRSSAPGKIILFGEHAVVYGRPALAAPVTQVQATVEVQDSLRAGIWIEALEVGLAADLAGLPAGHPVGFVVRRLLDSSPIPVRDEGRGLSIKITSTIPVASGLGSGAAVSVALIRALSRHLGQRPSDEAASSMAYEVEKLHHGTPSGIDNTVVTYAKPVYFVKGRAIEVIKVGRPFTTVIGDTGIHAPTKESVEAVRRLWEADKPGWEAVFDGIAQIVQKARTAIESGAWQALGALMNENHALLQELTVSSPELDTLVTAARNAGAGGAKMSGGGRGGNMIAVVEEGRAKDVAAGLLSAGAKRIIITTVS